MTSSEKNSDQIRKVQDQSKKQAEASRQIKVTEKAKREASVVKILDEPKKVMKWITAKHYQEMRDCPKRF